MTSLRSPSFRVSGSKKPTSSGRKWEAFFVLSSSSEDSSSSSSLGSDEGLVLESLHCRPRQGPKKSSNFRKDSCLILSSSCPFSGTSWTRQSRETGAHGVLDPTSQSHSFAVLLSTAECSKLAFVALCPLLNSRIQNSTNENFFA